MERITGPYKGRYFIHAWARLITPIVGIPYIEASAEIFDGKPEGLGKCSVARYGAEIASSNELDMMQSAESAARRTLFKLP